VLVVALALVACQPTMTPTVPPAHAAEPYENTGYSPAYRLQEFVDELNHETLTDGSIDDLISIRFEARGENTVAFVVRAEDKEMEDPTVAEALLPASEYIFPYILKELVEYVGISEPIMVYEFLAVDGSIVFTRAFTMEDLPGDTALSELLYDDREFFMELLDEDYILHELMLESYLEAHQAAAARIYTGGLLTVEVELRAENTIVYVFHVVEDGFDEGTVINEFLPNFVSWKSDSTSFYGRGYLSLYVEFFRPDGTLIASAEVIG